jgi:hypothetical protein
MRLQATRDGITTLFVAFHSCENKPGREKARNWLRAHAVPEDLAQEAGMSRAAFARNFSASVGEPPHSYLTRLAHGVSQRSCFRKPTCDSARMRHVSVIDGSFRLVALSSWLVVSRQFSTDVQRGLVRSRHRHKLGAAGPVCCSRCCQGEAPRFDRLPFHPRKIGSASGETPLESRSGRHLAFKHHSATWVKCSVSFLRAELCSGGRNIQAKMRIAAGGS